MRWFYVGPWCHGSVGHVALTIDDGLCSKGQGRALIAEVRSLLKERSGGAEGEHQWGTRAWGTALFFNLAKHFEWLGDS